MSNSNIRDVQDEDSSMYPEVVEVLLKESIVPSALLDEALETSLSHEESLSIAEEASPELVEGITLTSNKFGGLDDPSLQSDEDIVDVGEGEPEVSQEVVERRREARAGDEEFNTENTAEVNSVVEDNKEEEYRLSYVVKENVEVKVACKTVVDDNQVVAPRETDQDPVEFIADKNIPAECKAVNTEAEVVENPVEDNTGGIENVVVEAEAVEGAREIVIEQTEGARKDNCNEVVIEIGKAADDTDQEPFEDVDEELDEASEFMKEDSMNGDKDVDTEAEVIEIPVEDNSGEFKEVGVENEAVEGTTIFDQTEGCPEENRTTGDAELLVTEPLLGGEEAQELDKPIEDLEGENNTEIKEVKEHKIAEDHEVNETKAEIAAEDSSNAESVGKVVTESFDEDTVHKRVGAAKESANIKDTQTQNFGMKLVDQQLNENKQPGATIINEKISKKVNSKESNTEEKKKKEMKTDPEIAIEKNVKTISTPGIVKHLPSKELGIDNDDVTEDKKKVEGSLLSDPSYASDADEKIEAELLSPAQSKSLSAGNVDTVFSLSELVVMSPEDGKVDWRKREQYLSNEEFAALFSMKRDEFAELPHWRQKELKKRHRLF